MMLDSSVRKRLPVGILLAVVAVITVIDWNHDLGAWMMRPSEVVAAWESLRGGDFSSETLKVLATTTTSEFLHADMGHLTGNALFLWIFGVVVCELCGWRWLVAAFLITGVGGSIGQILVNVDSDIPTLGASGGLMGLEGFYFGLAFQRPRPEVEVWPLARPVNSTELAAAGVVGVFFDLFGILGPAQGIAFGAHLGGFVTGMLLSVPADRFIRPMAR
jgi:membrane associated rhomboid family serine protease